MSDQTANSSQDTDNRTEGSFRLALKATHALHRAIFEASERNSRRCLKALARANRDMASLSGGPQPARPLAIPLSALLLDEVDIAWLRNVARTLHGIVEKKLDYLLADPDRLAEAFPEHCRSAPFFQKTAGAKHWQVVSRYDLTVSGDGQLKLIELNTSCPGGLLVSAATSELTRRLLHDIDVDPVFEQTGTVPTNMYLDRLLAIENRAGFTKEGIGLLYDENHLTFELDLLASALKERGRVTAIGDAQHLEQPNGHLQLGDERLSLILNKYRISTPASPHHCWKAGFESRYAAFLDATTHERVVSINNLVGMTVAEDKSLLAHIRRPEFQKILTPQEQQFVERHILWTAPLKEGPVFWEGQETDLFTLLRERQQDFLVKPANEGRGYGVTIGGFLDPGQWEEACQIDPRMPKIVQKYSAPVQFSVPTFNQDRFSEVPMHLTLGLAVVDGDFLGVVSRISPTPVTNVARDGFGQAVFVMDRD